MYRGSAYLLIVTALMLFAPKDDASAQPGPFDTHVSRTARWSPTTQPVGTLPNQQPLTKEDMILRGAFGVALGIPATIFGTLFVRGLSCANDGEEFGGLACVAVGSMGAVLLLAGATSTVVGTIFLVRGLRMKERHVPHPRIEVDKRGQMRVSVRFGW